MRLYYPDQAGGATFPRTVLRAVQAHVQAGGGACLAGSGLDKVTDLVDQPEAITARSLLRAAAVPGEGISMCPVSATWQMSSSLVRQTCTVPPPPVWRKVLPASSPMAISKSGMRGGASPAPLALVATKRRTWRRSSTVAQRLGVRWRERQRPITSRRNLRRAQVCGACCLLPVPDDGRVGACRIGNDRLRKRGAVIGAQKSNGAVAESQVDQRLVPGCFLYLGGRAAGPDRLADAANALPPMLTGIGEDLRDDPRRITAQFRHVNNGYLR